MCLCMSEQVLRKVVCRFNNTLNISVNSFCQRNCFGAARFGAKATMNTSFWRHYFWHSLFWRNCEWHSVFWVIIFGTVFLALFFLATQSKFQSKACFIDFILMSSRSFSFVLCFICTGRIKKQKKNQQQLSWNPAPVKQAAALSSR